jgi:hypothetical protein
LADRKLFPVGFHIFLKVFSSTQKNIHVRLGKPRTYISCESITVRKYKERINKKNKEK